MASETDCLNDALGMIGASRITAIDDGSTNANHCLTFYPSLRDSLLRQHHWNFAVTRVQLALDVTAPVSTFAYAYTLPPDNLKVIDYGGSNPATASGPTSLITYNMRQVPYFKIEQGKLLSNDGIAYITYIRRITNPAEWDALFYQVLTTWLAAKLALAIPKDTKRASFLLDQAVNVLLPLALAIDGQEGSVEPFVADDLLWGR